MKIQDALAFFVNMQDSFPLEHFLREFLKNSAEAGATEVVFGRYGLSVDGARVSKLYIADNGHGIPLLKCPELILDIGASTKDLRGKGNIGWGSRLTSMSRNQAGILYRSWTDDDPIGAEVLLRLMKGTRGFDLAKNKFDGGINRAVHQDGSRFSPKRPPVGPKTGTGTMIVFLGNDLSEDTTLKPFQIGPHKGILGEWIHLFLNERFHALKNSHGKPMTIKSVRYNTPSGSGSLHTRNRQQVKEGYSSIDGSLHWLDKYSEFSGSKKLPNLRATVHYWVFPEKSPKTGMDNRYPLGRKGLAFLHDGELYHHTREIPAIRQFGLRNLATRTWLVIEPWGGMSHPDGVRCSLLDNKNERVEFSTYQIEFRDHLPHKLAQLESRATTALFSGKAQKSFADWVGNRISELGITRWVRGKTGKRVPEGDTSGLSTRPQRTNENPGDNNPPGTRNKPKPDPDLSGTEGNENAPSETGTGPKVIARPRRTRSPIIPHITWVEEKDMDSYPDLKGLAVLPLPPSKDLEGGAFLFNKEYPVFKGIYDRLCDDFDLEGSAIREAILDYSSRLVFNAHMSAQGLTASGVVEVEVDSKNLSLAISGAEEFIEDQLRRNAFRGYRKKEK